MEIYYRRGLWFSLIFAIPAIAILLIQIDIIEYANKAPDTAGYIIIGICGFLTILTACASTRLYFDNNEKACIQIRNHFYGQKRVIYPYVDILNIVVRLELNTTNNAGGYKVGFTKATTLFGQAATKYVELRHFGREQSDCLEAVKFAKEICEYTDLNYLDDSKIKRVF
jgi:hypothetical protein